MTYKPHTERIGADEELELPTHARGVSLERDGEEYVVHYLALTEEAREEQRERVREGIEKQPSTEENVEIQG